MRLKFEKYDIFMFRDFVKIIFYRRKYSFSVKYAMFNKNVYVLNFEKKNTNKSNDF